ncbi:hypothetical protein EW026_g647 [Hermanssonia centrifuga]|uniref:DH domain-containing protein n=1 Tax=Hermanssonia centrifuga TaxID=98765 RepID=A0A4S4KV33_9APHY|nr:hypothetical protein EW026_g647 [Hermanssonia centrifuga]
MALAYSPRKQVVPLAAGDDRPSLRSSHPTLTRRVYFCGVVVENADNGYELPPDVQDLVASLGDPLYLDESSSSSSNTDLLQAGNDPYVRKRAISDHSSSSATDYSRLSESSRPPPIRKRSNTVSNALIDITNELVATERSYVNRLRSLKTDYAEPLRFFSKNKDTAIIPPYEAKTLFGNIDQLLPINEAFLEDLEKMVAPGGSETVGGMGDVALKHFKDLKGFENYKQYYAKREEAQGIFEREMRKASGFSAFVDRIKYSSPDNRNRVGLRELLMDPVQRIPRYTLMFRTMIKEMSPHDPQRAKLLEADEIASKIALAETDEQTKRAAIMYCLSATVEDFPPALISNSRKFVDCIDVDDVLLPDRTSDPGTSVAGPNAGTLHCSLLLFDDKILILKRPSGEKGVRALTGLDDLDRSHKSKGIPMGMKKAGLLCKGVVDVTEVTASDVGGADINVLQTSIFSSKAHLKAKLSAGRAAHFALYLWFTHHFLSTSNPGGQKRIRLVS